MKTHVALALGILALLAASSAGSGVMLGQVDDFEDASTMSWMEGLPSPNPPENIPSGGPGGVDDNYLENESAGGAGPGSAQVIFNQSQWAGDYLTAGVTGIEAYMANFGSTDLDMRLALEGPAGSMEWYGSSSAVVIPAGQSWQPVSFSLEPGDLTQIQGAMSVTDVLSNVSELRFVAAAGAPDFRGDRVVSTLGVDDITAVPEPAGLFLLMIGLGAIGARRHRG